MSLFPSLPEDAGVRHILKLNPAAGRALLELHTAVLRTDTRLTARDKDLIAAHVKATASRAAARSSPSADGR